MMSREYGLNTCFRLAKIGLMIGIAFLVVTGAVAVSYDIYYDTLKLTDAAMPIPRGSTILVNVTNIGTFLGLTVIPDLDGYLLQSGDGRRWRLESSNTFLTSEGRMVLCSVPPILQGTSLFLPADTIAEITGLILEVDSVGKRLVFRKPEGPMASRTEPVASLADGWETFTIAKSKPAPIETKPINGKQSSPAVHLPPSRGKLNVRVGLGHVQDVDWGMELGASGRLGGGQVDFLAWLTNFDGSTRLKNSHLSWLHRERGVGIEAGDMYAETWGLVRGVRYTWDAGDDTWPSVGVYAKTDKTNNTESLLSLRDTVSIGKNFRLRSELGSDESLYTNLIWRAGDVELMSFLRHLPERRGDNKGLYISFAFLGRGSAFYGTSSLKNGDQDSSIYEVWGLRFPIVRNWDLTLQETEYTSEGVSTTSRSIGLFLPLNSQLYLLLRYQENAYENQFLSGELVNVRSGVTSLLTSLSLFASPRLQLDYQLNRYSQGGQVGSYEQLITNYRLSPRTTVQLVSGFPNISDTNLLRTRVNHDLGNGFSLVADYGRLSPYQSSDALFGKRGFTVLLRKTWPLSVPVQGATVRGVVRDQLGQPVESVAVGLGQYVAVTDKNGLYEFKCVPAGSYHIRVLDESIPADYKAKSSAEELSIGARDKCAVDFTLIPLGCISGCVFIDRNENAKCDHGEGVADVPICIDHMATSTNKDGIFNFYNLEPGLYTVRIATEALDARYVVIGESKQQIEMKPKESVSGIEFRITERKRPIVFVSMDE